MEPTAIQRALMTLGYDLGRGGADGIYGDDTKKAVEAFQADQGLSVDGVAGPITRPRIEAALRTQEVQAWLAELGYPVGPVVGVYDREVTDVSVRAFQAALSILVDGIPGRITRAYLQGAVKAKREAAELAQPPKQLLTEKIVRAVAPNARADIVAELLGATGRFAAVRLITPLRMAHFLAEIAVETNGLTAIEENLNYSVDGLLKTFGRHRISAADCNRYGRKDGQKADQEAIANIVYGGEFGRTQLGNTQDGDGWRYRGGGMMHTTGRANYGRAGFVDKPEELRKPGPALDSALKFWDDAGLNDLADEGGPAQVKPIRRVVNGGLNGLEDTEAFFATAAKALGV